MQHGITRLGTQVRLPDGREATVVFNSLVGVGVKFGLHDPSPEAFVGTDGNTMQDGRPEGFEWEPDALLRKPEMSERLGMPCVCDDSEVEITRVGLPANVPAQIVSELRGNNLQPVVGTDFKTKGN